MSLFLNKTRHISIAASAFAIVAAQPALALSNEDGTQQIEESEEDDTIIVQATRSGRRLQDEPLRVEVLDREEVEEKLLMRPGNIAMVVSETGGLRVQVTSPALGGANIRVHGMDGRYTAILSDGLPLAGSGSSLGLLQIPPADLGQFEVIKGSVSALYGASALGGVINLVSRRPGDELQVEALINATSRNGQDATGYVAAPLGGGWLTSLTGGYHCQTAQDLDDDGWFDMAAYDRGTIRPRLFWEGDSGASLYATASLMIEDRIGGTASGRTVSDGTTYVQAQRTERFDGGIVGSLPLSGSISAQVKLAAVRQNHDHLFGASREDDRHSTYFAEATVAGEQGSTNWVAGVAWQRDDFRSAFLPQFDYRYSVPGVFGQLEQELDDRFTLAGSARLDWHSRYGTQFSPRLSLLYRDAGWTVRASGGQGFFAPTPFIEEIEAAGMSRLAPLNELRAETATTASLDIGYRTGRIEGNVTLFGSNIGNATRLNTIAPDRVALVNIDGHTRTRGSEVLLRYRHGGYTLTGSYLYLDTSEPATGGGRQTVPLTPRHSFGLVGMWEEHDRGRIGVEFYYTGRQRLEDDRFRTRSRHYLDIGLLGEIVLGTVRLFVNAEDLLNIRQSRYDPMVRPTRASDGRWAVDMWAPAEGFVLNGGIRLRFGGGH
jgi:outer membrane receptor for ferrienterochelin and colicins